MTWKQQIESQIADLYPEQFEQRESMQALLDVAVAAEWFSIHTPQGHVFGLTQKTKYGQMREALDKLREVSDE